MLNVGQLNEGFVLDHIEAGKSMMIYNTAVLPSSKMHAATKWAKKTSLKLKVVLIL